MHNAPRSQYTIGARSRFKAAVKYFYKQLSSWCTRKSVIYLSTILRFSKYHFFYLPYDENVNLMSANENEIVKHFNFIDV